MPALQIDQPDALSDQPIAIRLAGFPPHATVEIVSTRRDFAKNGWRGWARYRTDDAGTLDLRRDAALEGSYVGLWPMGLFWSMELTETRADGEPTRDIGAGIAVQLRARALNGEDASAKAELRRRFIGRGVVDRWIREDGVVGRLFLPPGVGPHPAVIVLGGSSGGVNLPPTALLASRGYAALALGYFAMDGLPPTLDDIPLEYFERALAWLQDCAELGDFVGVLGTSRGGELALLPGATLPALQAVVAYVPSGVVNAGLTRRAGPAWTWRGEPVPALQHGNRRTDNGSVDWAASPVALAPIFTSSLRDEAAVARAMIAVERINGPVLPISGTDDQMWPSTAMADLAVQRLAKHGHPHAVEHLVYEGAGHGIFPPFAPTTRRHAVHAFTGSDFAFGGSAAADARAGADSWPKVLAFLRGAADL